MKKYALITVLIALGSCGPAKTTACIDPAKISNGACTMQYDPVCGCDGITYGNACAAGNAGVTSWKPGECDPK